MTPLVAVVAAAIAAAAFLPWITGPFGRSPTPWDLFREVPSDRWGEVPPALWVFFGSFALAALTALAAILGAASRLLTLLAGAVPFGLAAWAYFAAAGEAERAGIPLPRLDDIRQLQQATDGLFGRGLRDLLGPGIYAYFGGAALLLLVALLDPGARSRRP